MRAQVLALTLCPQLLTETASTSLFASDAIERAQRYRKAIPSMGAYSHSQGISLVRNEVAQVGSICMALEFVLGIQPVLLWNISLSVH